MPVVELLPVEPGEVIEPTLTAIGGAGLGLTEGESEGDSEGLREGLAEGLILGEAETEGLTETLGDTDGEVDGEALLFNSRWIGTAIIPYL